MHCQKKKLFTFVKNEKMVRNPEWTPRKFLTEAKKFSNEVLKVIEDNNY